MKKLISFVISAAILFAALGFLLLRGYFREKDDISRRETITYAEMEEADGRVPTIDRQVIFDKEGVRITATELNKKQNGWSVNFLIENNLDKAIAVQTAGNAINGIALLRQQLGSDLNCNVEARSQTNATLSIAESDLKKCGISEIRCLDTWLRIFDESAYNLIYETGQVEIKTSLYNGDHDMICHETIYSDENVQIDILGQDENMIAFAIKNKNDSPFDFSFSIKSVNGYTFMTSVFNQSVLGNCQGVFEYKISEELLKKKNITDIRLLEPNLSLRYFNDPNEIWIEPFIYEISKSD